MTSQLPQTRPSSCCVCGSDDHALVLRTIDYLFHIPGEYSVVRCRNCGHRFLNPQPTPDSLHLCYPQNYGPHQTAASSVATSSESPVEDTAPVPWYLRYLPLRRIPGLRALYFWLTDDLGHPIPKLPENDQPKLLELGCSTGAWLLRAQQAGWCVTGVEPGDAPAQTARDAGLNVRTGLLSEVELETGTFDVAAAWMVLEHVYDPSETLRELAAALRPGGQLSFSVPNAGGIESALFRGSWYVWEPPRHLHFFSSRILKRLLREAGFTDIRIVHQRNALNLIGSLGILLKRIPLLKRLTAGIGERLIRYPESPRLWLQLLLSPLAIGLAFLRQGGRLTVTAVKRSTGSEAG